MKSLLVAAMVLASSLAALAQDEITNVDYFKFLGGRVSVREQADVTVKTYLAVSNIAALQFFYTEGRLVTVAVAPVTFDSGRIPNAKALELAEQVSCESGWGISIDKAWGTNAIPEFEETYFTNRADGLAWLFNLYLTNSSKLWTRAFVVTTLSHREAIEQTRRPYADAIIAAESKRPRSSFSVGRDGAVVRRAAP